MSDMVLPCEYMEMSQDELAYTGGLDSETLKGG